MKLHYSILIIFIIALYTNMIIEFTLLFLCIILHELGHLFFILLFRQKIYHLKLTIFGGELNCRFLNLSLIKTIIIYSGGILVNFIIIIIIKHFPNKYSYFLYNYNYLLIVFNLLPIYPLDGYRIIEAILSNIHNPYREFTLISFLSLFTLIGLSIYSLLMKSLGLIFIAIYLFIKNISRINNKNRIVIHKFINMFS